MVDIDALTYIKVTETHLPDMFIGATVQSGTYQVSTSSGIGTFVLEPVKASDELLAMPIPGQEGTSFADAMDAVGGQQFHYRLVDDIFWQGLSRPEGQRWLGASVADMPVNVTGAFDGVALLDAAFSTTDVEVFGREPAAVGGTDWTVAVDADLVGPLGAQTGTSQRLLDAGFDGETGGSSVLYVHVDAAGFVDHVRADLSDWWIAAISEAQPGAQAIVDEIRVSIDIRFALAPLPFEVVAPCADPTTEMQQGIETLICAVDD
jgi:hypothetical protein